MVLAQCCNELSAHNLAHISLRAGGKLGKIVGGVRLPACTPNSKRQPKHPCSTAACSWKQPCEPHQTIRQHVSFFLLLSSSPTFLTPAQLHPANCLIGQSKLPGASKSARPSARHRVSARKLPLLLALLAVLQLSRPAGPLTAASLRPSDAVLW